MSENYSKFLPQIDKLIKEVEKLSFPSNTSKQLIKRALINLSNKQREAIQKGIFREEHNFFSSENFRDSLLAEIKAISAPSMRKVINATGTVIHTNLGRAPLSSAIIEEIKPFLTGYSDLEFDIKSGKRDVREKHLYQNLFGNHKMLVVNNNAAACLLVLNTLAKEKEVIVSRGELVEIGGSFRVPDIMRESGAILKEVGTTNKTKIKDYESAISDNTGLILKVHRSNFVLEGFTEEVSSEQLVSLSKRYKIPFYYDAGSGATELLSHLSKDEPIIEKEVARNVNVITFSGDKLLGGPQAGIIVAEEELIKKFKANPLYRALRPDKFTIFYLSRLFYYLSIGDLSCSFVIENLLGDENTIKRKAQRLLKNVSQTAKKWLRLSKEFSAPGGGALPGILLPTYVVKIKHPEKSEEEIKQLLMQSEPPVITRQKGGYTMVDLRTVFPEEIAAVAKAINSLFPI